MNSKKTIKTPKHKKQVEQINDCIDDIEPTPPLNTPEYLVIVESPSKCKKIENYLNSNNETMGAKVIATKGHLYTIKGLRDIDMKNGKFEINYSILENKEKYIVELRKYIKNKTYNKIILATDDDKEGEFIAWSICDIFKLSKETTPRIIFHEITEKCILDAFNNPTVINMNVVKSQQCRSVLDLLIGYKISPILWKQFLNPKEETLSAGRCQTPALSLIYDKNKEIQKEETRFYFEGTLKTKNITFTLTPPLGEQENEHNIPKFITDESTIQHFITKGENKRHETTPPKPFNTSTLLQQASIQLRMGPKQTMQIAQQLYQEGHITYMRTESNELGQQFKNQAKNYIIKKYGEEYANNMPTNPTKWASSTKNAPPIKNLPHEAIRCTHIETGGYLEGNDLKTRLYRLIWKHSIYSSMTNYVYNSIEYSINTNQPSTYKWKKNIEDPIFKGWKILDKTAIDEQTPPRPNLTENEPIKIEEIRFELLPINKKNTYYTESSLIKKLDELGIGRPSTFHSIVETLKDRGYVINSNIDGTNYQLITYKKQFTPKEGNIIKTMENKKYGNEKDKLIITPLGEKTNEFLIKHYETLFNYDYTKKMELLLDCIAEPLDDLDNINPRKICWDCLDEIKKCSKSINQSPLGLEYQGKEYELYYSQKGPLIRNKNDPNEIYNIKKNINLDTQLLDKTPMNELIINPLLGNFEDKPVYAKRGKFGPFIQWGDKNISIKNSIKKDVEDIQLEDVLHLLKNEDNILLNQNKKVLRIINNDISIRKGKYGKPYIFYKTEKMDKPVFVALKGIKNWDTCTIEEITPLLGC